LFGRSRAPFKTITIQHLWSLLAAQFDALKTTTDPRRSKSFLACSLFPPTAVAPPGQASSSTSTLFRSHSATANLPSLGKNCEAKLLTSQMSSAFQMRNNERLRCFHNAPPVGRRGEDVFRGIYCTIGKKVDKIVDALTSQKYDDLFTRRQGFVEVPRGSLVSEREWASLDTGRRVKFSPRIGVSVAEILPSIPVSFMVVCSGIKSIVWKRQWADEAFDQGGGSVDSVFQRHILCTTTLFLGAIILACCTSILPKTHRVCRVATHGPTIVVSTSLMSSPSTCVGEGDAKFGFLVSDVHWIDESCILLFSRRQRHDEWHSRWIILCES